MNIPDSLIEKWSSVKSYGDLKKLSVKAGVHKNTILNAFREKKCNDEVFKIIAEYYEEKIIKVGKYLPVKS